MTQKLRRIIDEGVGYGLAYMDRVNISYASLQMNQDLHFSASVYGFGAGLFFIAFPVVAFFLLRGGGLSGFGVSWATGVLSGFAGAIGDVGQRLSTAGGAVAVIGPLLRVLGNLVVWLGMAVSALIWPLVWLNYWSI